MKKFIPILFFVMLAGEALAQQPKLYLKVFAGVNSHTFVYKEEVNTSDHIFGWQGGFGFRVSYRKIFGEVDFHFIRSGVTVFLTDSTEEENEINQFDFKLNAFELPLKVGYIPVKTAYFKLFLYSGTAFRFNTKGKLKILGEEIRFKPKEVGLNWFNVDWIVGTQMDIGWLNIDIMYSLGVTNSIKSGIRTNSHEIQLNFGFLF